MIDATAHFAHCLSLALEDSGITGAELARRAHISPAHVSELRRGKAEPSLAVAERIALAFGCELRDFVQEATA